MLGASLKPLFSQFHGKSKSTSTDFRGFIFIYLKSKRCILVAVI
jgi:hypothetical protein